MADVVEYKLSIAIVTRNRPDLLEKCLASLYQQPHLWFEVLISDDSSESESIQKNREIAEAYHAQYLSGPQKGLYANRNFVAKHCKGTHIRTMDDDHTFPVGHFEACLQKIKEDPKAIWVIGEYSPPRVPPNAAPYRGPGELHPRGFSTQPKDSQNSHAISCGASIYPREVVDRNILNNEYFRFGYVYLEYGARLKYLGYRIRHLSDTFIHHNFIPVRRSFNNSVEILDSMVYALLSLSFVYQPTAGNKISTMAAITKALVTNKEYTVKHLLKNFERIKQLKQTVKS
ncbi:glycosyltransferase family 2 protein [Mucilaginibacter sp. PAMB04274]|uniref:glycosyltransferase family 2 protein n=1 Tax=Mucilaginibacter sp. PAMB04274 TaxID=3138568 RepID=UPI0031F6B4C1